MIPVKPYLGYGDVTCTPFARLAPSVRSSLHLYRYSCVLLCFNDLKIPGEVSRFTLKIAMSRNLLCPFACLLHSLLIPSIIHLFFPSSLPLLTFNHYVLLSGIKLSSICLSAIYFLIFLWLYFVLLVINFIPQLISNFFILSYPFSYFRSCSH